MTEKIESILNEGLSFWEAVYIKEREEIKVSPSHSTRGLKLAEKNITKYKEALNELAQLRAGQCKCGEE